MKISDLEILSIKPAVDVFVFGLFHNTNPPKYREIRTEKKNIKY